MSNAPPANATATQSTQTSSHRPHRNRRRGGNSNSNANANGVALPLDPAGLVPTQAAARLPQIPRNPALAFRPATVAAPSSPRLTAAATVPEHVHGHVHDTHVANGTQGRNRVRGGRGAQGRHQHTVVQSRNFAGALTAEDAAQTLQGDAPEFQPGQSKPFAPRQRNNQQPPRQRRLSKSTAPDISTRVHEDIDNGQYECPICTSEVMRRSKVWSCHLCWTVFHLDCVKRWANNSEAAAAERNGQNGANQSARQWRCPGCNLPQDSKPSQYSCWCGKELEPRPIPGVNPHSCGQSCGFTRACGHPCDQLCHAGPHPPCTFTQHELCFCGKQTATRKCTGTASDGGWSCGQPCGEVLGCGEHVHDAPCHPGLCGACEVPIEASCYCGRETTTISCCDKDDDKTSFRVVKTESGEEKAEEFVGCFKGDHVCDAPFDCGKHNCKESCHARDGVLQHCPQSPDVVSHCACGKTPLSELGITRTTCQDTIPNCQKRCEKPLACGHACNAVCHVGDCGSCLEKIEITCRCGRTTSTSLCHQGTTEPPQCFRACRVQLNCGRHACEERCCPGEHKAIERLTKKKKHRPLASAASRAMDDGFEAEHICTRICGRLLSCGNHFCENLDHKGACRACPEAVFEEIACNCGRTVLQPPLPCGTKPPPCRYDCERPKACGHPQVPHNCHADNENCPRCPFLVEKTCLCGKKTLKNQQCWFTDVRCGEPCGRKLKCGSHFCHKTCHASGECEDAHGECTQPCGKPKKVCDHPDEARCHAPYPCKEDQPCTHKVIVTCDCQNHKQEFRCSASKDNEGNAKMSLVCDAECARLERNRKLAVALNIDSANRTDDHVPYSAETLDLFAEHPKWCTDQEREFRVFAADESEKRLRMKPMPAHQRSFLHHLSEDFGFDCESMDPEPHRHVAIFKTPRFVAPPNKTLRDCARIRKGQRATANAEAAAAAKARSSVMNDPYNGFLLTNPKFALMLDDIETAVAVVQQQVAVTAPASSAPAQTATKLAFSVQFLSNGNVALKVQPSAAQPSNIVELALKDLRFPLARAFNAYTPPLGTLQLCRFDESLNVLRRELDTSSEGGWSQVAAKAAATRRAPEAKPAVAESGFLVLGNLAARKKRDEEEKKRVEEVKRKKEEEKEKRRLGKARREESVAEDWEEAEERAEEKEAKEMVTSVSGQESDQAAFAEVKDELSSGKEGADADREAHESAGEPSVLAEETAAEVAQGSVLEGDLMATEETGVQEHSTTPYQDAVEAQLEGDFVMVDAEGQASSGDEKQVEAQAGEGSVSAEHSV